MKRRDFLKSTGAVAGGLLSGLGAGKAQSAATPVSGPQPNILFILVDELRFPTVFPQGISTPDQFLQKFMPNLFTLWEAGVKFENYHTASNACTPARGTLITGLYSQQNWLLTTILSKPATSDLIAAIEPALNPNYPTYGKLLQSSGYSTPYYGKWHVSIPEQKTLFPQNKGLKPYGFDYYTYPDPTGSNLQGTYGGTITDTNLLGQPEEEVYLNDAQTASGAIQYLQARKPSDSPWCLTVSFVNPHDKEFFPAGTEYETVSNLFAQVNTANAKMNPPGPQFKQQQDYSANPLVPYAQDALQSPPSYGYPTVPPNWESTNDWTAQGKPTTQTFIKEFQQLVWGGVTDDPSQNTRSDNTVQAYPATTTITYGVAKMNYTYWQRALDSYTQIMQVVDVQIGRVLDALKQLPKSIVENTVIVFTSDHGEYAGAHGLVQGKLGTVYEEAWRVPLIVVDPSGRYTSDIGTVRTGLASSVDLATLLASIGNLGTRNWMKGYLANVYGSRLDMISMLKSASAPGRPYVLYATDEIAPGYYNFNNCPTHVLGLRTPTAKLGVYSNWYTGTSAINPQSVQTEFYDYSTTGGQLELTNTAQSDPRATEMLQLLLSEIIPNELQQLLPPPLTLAQEEAKIAHLAYRALVYDLPQQQTFTKPDALGDLLGYGRDF